MKLDKDLVREILPAIEASDKTPDSWINLVIESHSEDKISYHVMLLQEAVFIAAQDLRSMSDFDWRPKRLTIRGMSSSTPSETERFGALRKPGQEKPDE